MEIWKDIEGHEGSYQVSNLGNVKTLPKKYKNRFNTYTYRKELLLKPGVSNGYEKVSLTYNFCSKHISVHRLVAIAFIPNPENKEQVNHINGIKTDNRAENLEWCTAKENMQHAHKNRLVKVAKGKNHHKSIQVKNIITGESFNSITAAAKSVGISDSVLSIRLKYNHLDSYPFKYESSTSECWAVLKVNLLL